MKNVPPEVMKIAEYIYSKTNKAPMSLCVHVVYIYFSYIACWNRVSFDVNGVTTFPALYYLILMNQGTNKDRSFNIMNELCGDVLNEFDKNVSDFMASQTLLIETLIEEAESKSTKKLSKNAVDKISEKHRVDITDRVFYKASEEGLCLMRSNYQRMGFGCPFFKNMEAGGLISSSDFIGFFDVIKEAYDFKNESKALKSAKMVSSTKELPQICVIAMQKTVLDDDKQYNKLLEMRSSGGMRREEVECPDEHLLLNRGFKNMYFKPKPSLQHSFRRNTNDLEQEEEEMKGIISAFYETCKYQTVEHEIGGISSEANVYSDLVGSKSHRKTMFMREVYFSPEYFNEWSKYSDEVACNSNANKYSPDIKVIMEGMPIKVHRIACLNALIRHSREIVTQETEVDMNIEDLKMSISYMEDKTVGAMKIQKIRIVDDIEKLYGILKSNKGSYFSQTDIKKELGFKFGKKETIEFDMIVTELERKIRSTSEVLIKTRKGSRITYKIIDTNNRIIISQSMTNKATDHIFNKKEIDFYELHTIMQQSKGYSCSTFKDNFLKNSNWNKDDMLLILDIDNDKIEEKKLITHLTIKEAMKIISNYQGLIIETKSSRVLSEKNPLGIERFRIVLKLDIPYEMGLYITSVQMRAYKANIVRKIGLFKYIDVACLNVGRFYFGHHGKFHYTSGKDVIDLSLYTIEDSTEEIKIDYNCKTVKECTIKNNNNPDIYFIPINNTLFDMNKKPIYAKDANFDSVAIYCPNPEHKDGSPSAYLKLNTNGDPMVQCSGCRKGGYFTKR